MADYTEKFPEVYCPLAKIDPASYNSEQNTSRVNVGNYHRFGVLLSVGAMAGGATLDMDIEQHNAATGGTTKNITGKSITQLTQAGSDNNSLVWVEVQCEELDVDGGFHWVSVELTPASAATICGVILFGAIPRYPPVPVTGWNEIVT